MTEIELHYILERAASAAEACLALGRPQDITTCILDGWGGREVHRAFGPAAPIKPAAASAPSPAADKPAGLQSAELLAACSERFAAQCARTA